ncbi:MAG TPA: hypothetical protein VMW89_05330 [Desulfatiglandales bacterium]|nr:hypothetical protein [Desulfatiglandales bacterium]
MFRMVGFVDLRVSLKQHNKKRSLNLVRKIRNVCLCVKERKGYDGVVGGDRQKAGP